MFHESWEQGSDWEPTGLEVRVQLRLSHLLCPHGCPTGPHGHGVVSVVLGPCRGRLLAGIHSVREAASSVSVHPRPWFCVLGRTQSKHVCRHMWMRFTDMHTVGLLLTTTVHL